MEEYFYYGCEVVFIAVKVGMTFQLVAAVSQSKQELIIERLVQILVTVGIAFLSLYNLSLLGVLFSSTMMLIELVVLWIPLNVLYKIRWGDSFLISYSFWLGLAIVDFFIQTLIYVLLGQFQVKTDILLQIGWQRGLYLLMFSFGVVKIEQFIEREVHIILMIQKRRLLGVCVILVLTPVVFIYFQRIYIKVISDYYIINWILFWMTLLLMAIVGFIIVQKVKIKEREEMLQLKLQMMEENYQQTLKMYQEKSTLLHDEKHHMRVLNDMLENGEVSNAIQYIGTIIEELNQSGSRVWSKNLLLDLIFNMKIQEARKNNIDIKIDFADMQDLNVREKDICVLFSNLLDNAIEANKKITIGERWIKLYGEKKGHMLVINMSNVIGKKIRMEDGKLVTDKIDKKLHGFGMRSIQQVIEVYHGHSKIIVNEDTFLITIYLVGFD